LVEDTLGSTILIRYLVFCFNINSSSSLIPHQLTLPLHKTCVYNNVQVQVTVGLSYTNVVLLSATFLFLFLAQSSVPLLDVVTHSYK
jgi:hypothetical protein